MLDEKKRERLQGIFYPNVEDVVIGPARRALDQYVQPGAKVLDAGCGKGTWLLRKYRGIMGTWTGVDVQPPPATMMNEFVSCDLEDIPFKDESFNIILCHYVIEHLRKPREVFTEFHRLLSGGGILVFCTPCLNSPIFRISSWIPNRWHKKIKSGVFGAIEDDVFPTYYKCNTTGKIDKTLRTVGFRRETLETTEHSYKYLRCNTVTYAFGLVTSRLIQSLPLAKPFRGQILGVYRKL